MNILFNILEAFILGLIAGAIPGPILTGTLSETLVGELKRGVRVILKAFLIETTIALLIVLLVLSLEISQLFFQALSLGGTVVLIWLAYQVYNINNIHDEKKEIFTLSKIFLLTILNGGFWIFWLTVCVPKAYTLKDQIFQGHILFILFFEIGWLLSIIFISVIFSKFKPMLLKKKLVGPTFKFFALILIFFAIKSVLNVLI
jgi:threonine/homoserine/homoserine lactone efflux protein